MDACAWPKIVERTLTYEYNLRFFYGANEKQLRDLLFMKCTVCIDSETGECQVLSARVADFVRCVLFVPG